ncbi:MAG: outer membrane protein assembly factor BamD [Pseudomonadota bacterium]|nr:outer membrane protein assembly factor BamD [Pseudomonadota bacterium]
MKKFYGLLAVMLLAGCASEKVSTADMPVENLYNSAFDNLQKTKYKKAAEEFELVEIEHPYSQWAVKAKLMGAYSYYKNEDYDDAVLALDRFIKYHPGNKDVAYAYYLKGMCYYDQISSADKDQANTEKAEETFNRLIMLFPDSQYAEDARKKVNLTEDYKAGQEMIIGRYYLNNGNYLSALNRFNVVLENYQTTVQIEEALYRQVEIYGILGLNKYAAGYYKILQSNYPDGIWTAKAANVMKKIEKTAGKQKKTAEKAVEAEAAPTEEKTSGSWFGWFGSDDNAAEVEQVVEEKAVEAEAAPAEEKTSGSWFGWFGSDDNAAEVEQVVEEKAVEAEAAPAEEKTSSSWFGWFGSDDNAAEAEQVVEEKVVETEAAPAEEKTSGGWFGWFGSDDNAAEAEQVVEEKTVETEAAPAEEAVISAEEKEQGSVPVNIKVSQKAQVGDIISSNRKGKR